MRRGGRIAETGLDVCPVAHVHFLMAGRERAQLDGAKLQRALRPARGCLTESKQTASDTGRMTIIRKRRLSPQPRRTVELLGLLASSPHGATEALLERAHGFDGDMIAGVVRAGLATAERETMKAGVKPIEVVRLRITAAGREAVEE